MISDRDVRYDLPGEHPLTGAFLPDLPLGDAPAATAGCRQQHFHLPRAKVGDTAGVDDAERAEQFVVSPVPGSRRSGMRPMTSEIRPQPGLEVCLGSPGRCAWSW